MMMYSEGECAWRGETEKEKLAVFRGEIKK
jgi:hypothetical protein